MATGHFPCISNQKKKKILSRTHWNNNYKLKKKSNQLNSDAYLISCSSYFSIHVAFHWSISHERLLCIILLHVHVYLGYETFLSILSSCMCCIYGDCILCICTRVRTYFSQLDVINIAHTPYTCTHTIHMHTYTHTHTHTHRHTHNIRTYMYTKTYTQTYVCTRTTHTHMFTVYSRKGVCMRACMSAWCSCIV